MLHKITQSDVYKRSTTGKHDTESNTKDETNGPFEKSHLYFSVKHLLHFLPPAPLDLQFLLSIRLIAIPQSLSHVRALY